MKKNDAFINYLMEKYEIEHDEAVSIIYSNIEWAITVAIGYVILINILEGFKKNI